MSKQSYLSLLPEDVAIIVWKHVFSMNVLSKVLDGRRKCTFCNKWSLENKLDCNRKCTLCKLREIQWFGCECENVRRYQSPAVDVRRCEMTDGSYAFEYLLDCDAPRLPLKPQWKTLDEISEKYFTYTRIYTCSECGMGLFFTNTIDSQTKNVKRRKQ